MTLKTTRKIRTINGRDYIYETRPTKIKGSKYMQRKDHYVGPVKKVYKKRVLNQLTEEEIRMLDSAWRKGMTVTGIGIYIKKWYGRRPADSSVYQWFAKRGVKRNKNKKK